MKILLVHNRYIHPGGEEMAVASLESLLRARGQNVQQWGRDSAEWARHSPFEKILDAGRVLYAADSRRQLEEVLASFAPDIVHFHNVFPVLSPSVLIATRRTGTAAVQTLHNYRWLCANGLFLTPSHQICERCKEGNFSSAVQYGCYGNSRIRSIPMAASLALHRARGTAETCIDRFIAPSQFVRDKYISAGFPADRVDVIPNALDDFPHINVERSQEPLFVYVGRLSSEKGIETLINAFEKVPARLVVLGDGPLRGYCESSGLMQSGRLTLAGHVSRQSVFEWLARAWALVMPSACYEALPTAVLESWSLGTPVIASDLGAMAELVRDNETGWRFPAGNAEQLSQCLHRLIQDPGAFSALADPCRAAMQNIYNNDVIFKNLMTTYEHAFNRRPRALAR